MPQTGPPPPPNSNNRVPPPPWKIFLDSRMRNISRWRKYHWYYIASSWFDLLLRLVLITTQKTEEQKWLYIIPFLRRPQTVWFKGHGGGVNNPSHSDERQMETTPPSETFHECQHSVAPSSTQLGAKLLKRKSRDVNSIPLWLRSMWRPFYWERCQTSTTTRCRLDGERHW